MEFECFIWIVHIWKELLSIFPPLKGGDVRPLPNDIIFEILSRLPADEVLKCCSVSKEWKALVLTPFFSQAQLTRACPIVFIQYRRPESHFFMHGLDVFFLDQGAKNNRMIEKVYNKPTLNMQKIMPKLAFSYNGFIIFKEYKSFSPSTIFFIYNPITQAEITLENPVWSGDLCVHPYSHLTQKLKNSKLGLILGIDVAGVGLSVKRCNSYKWRIWELENSTKWVWVERYNINLDWNLNRYPFSSYYQQYIKLLNIQDGELLLC
ncbi:conserved hypothetical protein [Ricinus communis]|uniref:F-box domain-containing protein n=1 Tax=Ricinus communis TaxID=3988 RepID=B9R8B9_RICCO|nr:conserved hypothetical protein [Ricinus communis]